MIVTQVAAVSRLDSLVSLPHVTLLQVHLKCASCTHRHRGPREVTGNTLAVGPQFVTLFAVRSRLDAATAAWLSREPVLRLGLPMPLPPPTITCLGQDTSPPPLLFMEISEAHSDFPTPFSQHHASRCSIQDPATPTQSKIKPGGPSQHPHPNIQPNTPCLYFSPSTGAGVPVPQ